MFDYDLKLIKPGEIRVRIAPSPTGPLHIGTARTALFNYLFAKANEGSFILRIEDTDIERSDPKWEKDIIETLKWLGIEWSEGPFRQSERVSIYEKYIKKLLAEKKAYYCFCSPEELEAQRQYLMSIGQAPRYNKKCANLPDSEVKKLIAQKKPSIIRFRVPVKKVKISDLTKGKIEFDSDLIGDIAIARDLKTPLYNLAAVIDDFEMKISHVIRGEDHLPNTPKQILIQEALNFPQPQYAHLPLILGPDRSKLSKRHGAIAVSTYRDLGYLPEAIVNFMAFLGWNPGDDREIFSLTSLIKEFSLKGVQKGGAVFNIKRLDFLNGFYIRQKSIEKLTDLCLPFLIKAGLIEKKSAANYKIKEIISIYQERLKRLSEITELADFFFKEKIEYNKELLKWKDVTDKEVNSALSKLKEILTKIKEGQFSKDNLERVLITEAEAFSKEIRGKVDRGYLLWPLRAALTGKQASAGPFEIAEIMGKEKVLVRIDQALQKVAE